MLSPSLQTVLAQLTQTQDWCYHEGSYGHNPEYGATHILTLGSMPSNDLVVSATVKAASPSVVPQFLSMALVSLVWVPHDVAALAVAERQREPDAVFELAGDFRIATSQFVIKINRQFCPGLSVFRFCHEIPCF